MNRPAKQFLYFFGYAALFVFAIGSIYAVLKPPPSCFDRVQNQGESGVDCGDVCGVICSSQLSPIQERGRALVFSPTKGTIAILASVANPNQDYAVKHLSYRLVWTDASGLKHSLPPNSTWLYAGEVKYVVGFADVTDTTSETYSDITAKVEFMGAPEWAKKADFTRPEVVARDVSTSQEGNNLRAKAVIVNNDTAPLSTVQAVVVFYDKLDLPAGIAPASTQNLGPGEVREISAVHPASASIDPARTAFFLYGLR